MSFLPVAIRHASRNMLHTWRFQALTLFTISLSVLIFSFFYLIYSNAINAGQELGDELRLVAYLDEEPSQPLQQEYKRKILKFDQVERIAFISRLDAYQRFEQQLGNDKDVLHDIPTDFLPPSIEVYPIRSLDNLSRIKRFSDYLQTLPGVIKVQYGKEWIERFYSFVQLMRLVVILSGSLLIMTTTFMVAHTIRLTLLSRQEELELLKIIGATNNYIRTPYLMEGALLGLIGSCIALVAVYLLFNWIKFQFIGSTMFEFFPFVFFSLPVLCIMVLASTLLCAAGSFSSTRRILHL